MDKYLIGALDSIRDDLIRECERIRSASPGLCDTQATAVGKLLALEEAMALLSRGLPTNLSADVRKLLDESALAFSKAGALYALEQHPEGLNADRVNQFLVREWLPLHPFTFWGEATNKDN